MKEKKNTGWWILGVIALLAGVALAVTNAVTAEPIERQGQAQANEAVRNLLPNADMIDELDTAQMEELEAAYAGRKGDAITGYAAQTTVRGYAGPIQIILGMDPRGTLTGINVGGSDFVETEGVGSKTREEAFTGQFVGKTVPLTLGSDVDAVSGATISSRAVTQGVNAAAASLSELAGLELDLTTDEQQTDGASAATWDGDETPEGEASETGENGADAPEPTDTPADDGST